MPGRPGAPGKSPREESPGRPARLLPTPRVAPCEVGWEEITLFNCQGAPLPAPRLCRPSKANNCCLAPSGGRLYIVFQRNSAKSARGRLGHSEPGRTQEACGTCGNLPGPTGSQSVGASSICWRMNRQRFEERPSMSCRVWTRTCRCPFARGNQPKSLRGNGEKRVVRAGTPSHVRLRGRVFVLSIFPHSPPRWDWAVTREHDCTSQAQMPARGGPGCQQHLQKLFSKPLFRMVDR